MKVDNSNIAYATGAQREDKTDKGRYDLLPPEALHALAVWYEQGGKRYGDRNWEKGLPLSLFLSAAIRHAYKLLRRDRSEDHASAVAWNALGFAQTVLRIERGELPAELDDFGFTGRTG